MFKHATINLTSRTQQALQFQRNCQPATIVEDASSDDHSTNHIASSESNHDVNNNLNQTPSPLPTSCNSSPSPSLQTTPIKSRSASATGLLSSSLKLTTSSLGRSPTKLNVTPTSNKSGSASMIKVFAQTLSQDVEYVTLHVNAQTKSNQVVKSLLKKFRLKHRDPNLFYLTLERWIRKDGLKFKSVMLLGDEACPLQLQQCCSNPPHNDIKFTLQMRTGALVKIFCSDIVPDARYKCLSLSTQTTVDETVELMLHCLNLVSPNGSVTNNNSQTQLRSSNSPVGSTSSSVSSNNSSSSGIESDPTDNHRSHQHSRVVTTESNTRLDLESRASSVTSISSSSNMSNLSSSVIDQYCMVIECKDSGFKRVLDPDEYLVDVYQNLLAEAKGQPNSPTKPPFDAYGNTNNDSLVKEHPDQWFFIKLKRRGYDLNNISYSNSNSNKCTASIQSGNKFSCVNKFNNTRQNIPLPPIPSQTPQFTAINNDNINSLKPVSSNFINNGSASLNFTHCRTQHPPIPFCGLNLRPPSIAVRTNSLVSRPSVPKPIDQVDAGNRAVNSTAQIVLHPPIRPRRRNLSNASSTFGRPLPNINRRRYDPAQLAEDLHKLDINVKEGEACNVSTLEGQLTSLT